MASRWRKNRTALLAAVATIASGLVLVIPALQPTSAAPGGVVIDTFDDTQSLSNAVNGTTVTGFQDEGAPTRIAGDERDAAIFKLAGSGTLQFDANVTQPGAGAHGGTGSPRGYTLLTYDGNDDNATHPAGFAPTGLNNLDLTGGGLATAFVVDTLFANNASATMTITVWDNSTTCSSLTKPIPTTFGAPQAIVFPFASFATGADPISAVACAGGPADLTSAGAVQVKIDATVAAAAGMDLYIDLFETANLDFGDLPNSYASTTVAQNGAGHVMVASNPTLGATVDEETDGAPSGSATGDDAAGTDDEDGVALTPGFGWSVGAAPANGGRLDVTTSGANGCLNVWIDFNEDNVLDVAEMVVEGALTTTGTVTHQFDIPGGTTLPNEFFTRTRLFQRDEVDGLCDDWTVALGNERTPDGAVTGGEVEDHLLAVAPEIAISKTDGVTSANPGDSLTYTISVANTGSATATGVDLDDTIPAETSFSSADDCDGDASGAGTELAGVVSWPAFNVAAGDTVNCEVTVTVDADVNGATSLTNSAAVTNTGDPTPPGPATDVDALQWIDLAVTKSDGKPTTESGETLTYTVQITNNGNVAATGVVVTDTIPGNTTYVAASASDGGTHLAGVITWNIASLGAGASVNRTFQATVANPLLANVINNVSVTHDTGALGPDQDSGDNTASDTDTPEQYDLAVTKTDSTATVQEGGSTTYVITVTNNGAATAYSVLIEDTIPANATFGSATAGYTIVGGDVEWTIASLAPGQSANRSLTINIDAGSAPGSLINDVEVSANSVNGPDEDLSDNTFTDTDTITAPSCGTGPCTVAGGYLFSCGVTGNGVKCWGHNGSGQLGNGSTVTRSLSPVPVTGLGTGVEALAAGRDHVCALLSTGGVRCWGNNSSGQLGDNTTTTRRTPVNVLGITNATGIAAGERHTCAVLSTGGVSCWGNNNSGQLGTGTTTSSKVPVAVPGITTATAVAVGGDHSCVVLANGTARCWGANASGQVGDGSRTTRKSPVAVSGLANAVSIDAGFRHTCVVLADATAQCWGHNSNGGLGNGTKTLSTTPVTVSGLSGAASISAGSEYTCAVRTDNTVRCWGLNNRGQVGDGTRVDRLTPVPVAGLGNVSSVSAGYNQTLARQVSCNVMAWGDNAQGQLGDNTKNLASTPVDNLA